LGVSIASFLSEVLHKKPSDCLTRFTTAPEQELNQGVSCPCEVGGVAVIFAFIGCVLLGFLAGLLCFKVKSRWCPQCGTTTAEITQRQLLGR
jgi:hypothetical protein